MVLFHIKNLIKKIDIFGILVSFNIDFKNNYKSIYGGIGTLILFTFSISITLLLGFPFFQRKNIEFIYSNKIVQTQPYINLTEAHFKFGFGIQYQDTALPAINDYEKYFNYSIILKEWIGKDKITESPFNLKKCDYSDFLYIENNSFDVNHIEEMFCPILNDSFNYTLEGLFTDDYTKFIQLQISLTEYGMDNLDELRKNMQTNPIEMVIYFLDTGIDYQNRNYPLPLYINYINKGLDLYFEKTTEIFLSKIEFKNDDNLIFNKENKTIDGMLDKSHDSFHYIVSRTIYNETIIGKFILKTSSKIIVLDRQYQKLPNFAAELSGMIEQCFVVILFIVNIIQQQAVENKIIHKMLKMKGSKNYNIDYLLSVFNRDKINNSLNNLINEKNFPVEKEIKNNNNNHINKINNFNKKKILVKDIIHTRVQSNEMDDIKLLSSSFQIIQKPIISNSNETNENLTIIEKNQTFDESNKIKNNLNQYNIKENENQLNNKENINNNSSSIIIKEEKDIKKAEKDFPSLNVFSTIYSLICFWSSKYQKRKYELINKTRDKINYYLEVFNYIKGMQEIDLFKYCLFDNEQLTILDYLSKPPFRIEKNKNNIYKYEDFEKTQKTLNSFEKNDIDNIYNSYNKIINKKNLSIRDLKLIKFMNAEIEYLI